MATSFLEEGEFDKAHVHIQKSKSYMVDNSFHLGRIMELEVRIWYRQQRFEKGTPAALRVLRIFEEFGVATKLKGCRNPRNIERVTRGETSEPSSNGERKLNT